MNQYKHILDAFSALNPEQQKEVFDLLAHNMKTPGNYQSKKDVFLSGKSNNRFTREIEGSNEGNYLYKLSNIRGDVAEFEYIGDVNTIRSQYNAVFDNVAKTTGSALEANGYETVKKGTVKKQNDAWVVQQLLVINFTR